ncbi:MAG: transglycosylase family protein [Solirubrobacteraceae bacterium]
MYVPATPQTAAPLAPVGIESSDPTIITPARTVLHVRNDTLEVLADRRTSVTGTLTDTRRRGLADELVALEALGGHGWRPIARTHTGARGRFRVSYLPRELGHRRTRLRFAGDASDRPAQRRLGRLTVLQVAEAKSRWPVSSAFVQCVTMRESSMNWHIIDPPYSGGDQWTESTWRAAGGGRYTTSAAQATPEQQARVFEEYEPSHPGAWPVTVPACS